MEYYISVDVIGDYIYERYIEDGIEKTRKVKYEPTFYYASPKDVGYTDIYGKMLQPKKFDSIRDSSNWMKRMTDMAQDVCGMDDIALQYIYENYHGPISYDISNVRIAYVDIEVHSTDGFPFPEVARWPIDAITHYDTVDDKYYVFSTREWWREKSILDDRIKSKTEYRMFQTESDMMLHYVAFWRRKTPAIVTGWNSELFDIPYIINRLKKLFGETAPNKLSPWGKIKSRTISQSSSDSSEDGEPLDRVVYTIAGVASLDYMDMFKKFTFKNHPTYRLGYISEYVLGETKIEYDGPLHRLAIENPQLYVDYNIKDVDLIVRMDKALLLFELVCSLTYYSHMNFDGVMSPLKTWDAIIYNSLMSQSIVVPENKKANKEAYEGAYVKDPLPGLYRWVVSFDLASLYPHLIMQYNISPETIIDQILAASIESYIDKTATVEHQGHSCAANGMLYSKTKRGIIPTEVEKVFLQRKAAKKSEWAANSLSTLAKNIVNHRHGTIDKDARLIPNGIEQLFGIEESKLEAMNDSQLSSIIVTADRKEKSFNVEQMVRKVLINSLYGALGNQWFRYYDLRNAEAITLSGQLSIRWIERKLNEYFNRVCGTTDFPYVIYIDTDSVYLNLEQFVAMMVNRSGKTEDEIGKVKLVDMLDKFAVTKVEPYINESYAELAEYMNAYAQKMLMDREVIADTGFWTKKKKYALNVWDSEGKRNYDKDGNLVPKLKIMGLETQKSSTPVFVQKALKESIRIILQESQDSLQNYFAKVEQDYKSRDYREIAEVSTVNDIMKHATPDMWPLKGCTGGAKTALAYNRLAAKYPDVNKIMDGEKVAKIRLREPNPLGVNQIGYPSGEKVPDCFGVDVNKHVDYNLMMEKTFVKPLSTICDAIKWDYKRRATLGFLF